jgi:hypothetical protein
MQRYHYRIIESTGYIHANWLFADNWADAWRKLADAAGRMADFKGLTVASLHIDRVTD